MGMTRAIIFDFDGVILESAGIKTKAFGRLFESEYPDKVEAIVAYHLRNAGISRYVKFDYIYEHILKKPLSTVERQGLGLKFSDIVFEEILKAPFVPGALEFLQKNRNDFLLFVASGTPAEELSRILDLRHIKDFFREAHGSPRKKQDVVADILQRYALHKEDVVFVGDAESDLSAAVETGVPFVARITPESGTRLMECRAKISDLSELNTIIMQL